MSIEETNPITFEEALKYIKKGGLAFRRSWSERDMFIFLVNGSNFKVNRAPLNEIFQDGTDINYRPHIDMKTSDGSICVWTATQSDILAEDWFIK